MRTVFAVLALMLFFVPAIEADSITLSLDNVPLKSALDKLFSETGKAYTLDAGINPDANIASVSIVDVPFDIALKGILKSIGLQYKADAAAYTIQKMTLLPNASTPVPAADTEPPSLRMGMNKFDVLDLMGKPEKTVGVPGNETWTYPDCLVVFRRANVFTIEYPQASTAVSVGSSGRHANERAKSKRAGHFYSRSWGDMAASQQPMFLEYRMPMVNSYVRLNPSQGRTFMSPPKLMMSIYR